MEYQKIINLLEKKPNQTSKYGIKSWVEVNDESSGTYNVHRQIEFRTLMLRSRYTCGILRYTCDCNYNKK